MGSCESIGLLKADHWWHLSDHTLSAGSFWHSCSCLIHFVCLWLRLTDVGITSRQERFITERPSTPGIFHSLSAGLDMERLMIAPRMRKTGTPCFLLYYNLQYKDVPSFSDLVSHKLLAILASWKYEDMIIPIFLMYCSLGVIFWHSVLNYNSWQSAWQSVPTVKHDKIQ